VIRDRRLAWRILIGGAGLITLARILWAGLVQLCPDEAWYWSWGRNLALSYRDHPPLLGWILCLIPEPLGGSSEVWVRLPALASGLVLLPLTHVLCREAGASRTSSLVAAFTGCLSLMACAGAVIVTPDAPLLVLWTLGLILSVRLARGGSPWLLAAAAGAAGAACLAKLPGLLLLLGIGAAVIPRRDQWRRLVAPAIVAALAIGAALALIAAGEAGSVPGPVRFQMARLADTSPSIVGPVAFLAALVGLAGVLPAGGVVPLASGRLLRTRPAAAVLAWSFWPALAGFTLLAAIVHVEPNWGAVAFPSLFAGWALLLDGLRERGRGRGVAAAALVLNVLLALLVHLHAAGLLAAPYVGRGPAARLHGWRELVRVIGSTGPGRLETDEYGLAAPLSYYGRGTLDVVLEPGEVPDAEPEAVWRVEDGRLGLSRRVEGWRSGEGFRIRCGR
jgi:4-amino-4-deoxy-L-arabinose transferase-like glycosyltransferase